LKLTSVGATAIVFAASLGYASAHVYNASAPLQPTVATANTAPARPSVAPARSRQRQTSPFVAPNIAVTGRSPLTSTHSS
jgi:hypothetical protein